MCLFIGGLFWAPSLWAIDGNVVDSLRQQLERLQEDDKAKVHLLNLLAWELRYEQSEEALKLAEEARSISSRTENKIEEAYSLNLIGIIQKRAGNYGQALQYILDALVIREQLGDREGMGRSLNNIGSVLKSQGKYDEALQYYERSLSIRKEIEDLDWLNTLYNMGNLMSIQRKFDKALGYYQSALDGFLLQKDTVGVADTYSVIGNCYNEQEDYNQAVAAYLQALVLYQKLDDQYSATSLLLDLGGLKQNQEQYQEAIDYYLQSLSSIKQLEDAEMLLILYENLSYCYEQTGSLSKALETTYLLQELKDSIFNEESIQALEEARVHYESEKKEQANQLLEAESRQKSWQNSLLLVVVVFLLLVVSGLIWSYRQKQLLTLQKEQLHKQEVKGLLQQQELRSLDSLMEGQETERKRIAQELHDRLGSMLSTIKLHFSALESRLDEQVQQQSGENQRLNYLLDEACEEVRRISHNVETGVLRQFGLVSALEDLVETVNSSGQIKLGLSVHNLSERMDLSKEITIYRIVQELLSNVLKHAQAKEVNIQLTQRSDSLSLLVEDDGKGFDMNQAKNKEGIGLGNITARVKKLQGHWNIDSAPDKGTTAIVDIPV